MSLKELFPMQCLMPSIVSNVRGRSVSRRNAGAKRRRRGKLRQLWLPLHGYTTQNQLALAWIFDEPIPPTPKEAAELEALMRLLGMGDE